jgi:hypothetical protein
LQASSVPCKHLFSSGKHIADDYRSRLGAGKFEQLQILKLAWWSNIKDLAAWNSSLIEEVNLLEYEELLADEWEEASLVAVSVDEFIESEYY